MQVQDAKWYGDVKMTHEPNKICDIARMLFPNHSFFSTNLMSCQQALTSLDLLMDDSSVIISVANNSKESSQMILKVLTSENMSIDVNAHVMTDILKVGYGTQPTLHSW